ncbi:MAG TPA: tRNA (adenosine(37)-N6)-threonylcarbamoyltransferase complex dimerization subunit type 1 TsaB [Actinomycetota bacterium]|nr:tRNA (adenosine(37)-N6)-threonylcarbamoyltransferase complex dimerization subunit type 1 TsaB [Actinomycetota bacterium]
MLVLGIDTSTPQASVAIGSEQGVVASALVSRGANYNEFLLPAIRFCLDEAGIGFRNIGAVAVDIGPGLFAGMRVGVATAKALSQALAVPIVGITSLDLLAYGVRYSSKTICAVLDARRGEVFDAFYRSSPGGVQRMTDYRVERPGRLAIGIASRPEEVLLVGSGALLYRDAFDDLGTLVELGSMGNAFPDAKSLVELSLPRLAREEFDSVDQLAPLYLRRSAQPIRWETIRGSKSA